MHFLTDLSSDEKNIFDHLIGASSVAQPMFVSFSRSWAIVSQYKACCEKVSSSGTPMDIVEFKAKNQFEWSFLLKELFIHVKERRRKIKA